HKGLALLTLLLDGGKGAMAVLLAYVYGPDTAAAAGAGALLGHLFPVWLRFKGGKGVATALGVLLAMAWPAGLIACGVWLAVAAVTRYSSLAALVALAAAPIAAWFLAFPQTAELALFSAVVVCWRHAGIVRRRARGEEPRIGRRQENGQASNRS
ncbi:MAG: glycerol-3-phosphate acyltransferase, partial [Alphaproteobacteria bacterium]